jgi:phosphoribosyl 1,2-cyclic phosphate phosphodiesterase
MILKVTILGCGSSGGVPLITGNWGNCDPKNPKNNRTRASVLVQTQDLNILIDTSPDLRQQLLRIGVDRIDAVLYTHTHADHVFGIDELRQIYMKHQRPIPIYADAKSLAYLQRTFAYIFHETDPLYPAFLKGNLFEGAFHIQGVEVTPFLQDHGGQDSFGFRIGDFAYSTDFKEIPADSLAKLTDLNLWVVDCLRDEAHKTHTHYDHTMALIKQLKPQRAILTHMTQYLDYESLRKRCPAGVEPAYDGMVVEVD